MSKRTSVMIKLKFLSLMGKNHSKANILRKSKMFAHYGEGGYWHPDWIPSFPEYISIGDNVTVAADVRMYEHDMIQRMWNEDPAYKGNRVRIKKDNITIGNNVVLGAKSILLYGITVGDNSVVASGAVVTKDVPPYSIVGGNPAKVIGNTKDLFMKRVKLCNEAVLGDEYENYFE